MPVYAYQCPTCGAAEDRFNRVSDCESNAPVHCGSAMRIRITAPLVHVQQDINYRCPATGIGVTSWRQRRNIFAEHRLRDANDHPPEQVIRDESKKWERIKERANVKLDLPDEIKNLSIHDLVPEGQHQRMQCNPKTRSQIPSNP